MTPAKLIILIGLAALVAVAVVVSRPKKPVTVATLPGTIRYLPLGDSYTIGQSVAQPERWPDQLVVAQSQKGVHLQILANPAVTGYTTQNLIDRELPLVSRLKPDFVTLAIGVNDYVQGINVATFEANLDSIIRSVQPQLARPSDLLLLTIPDYGATPTGARFGDPATSRAGIEAFNAVISRKATQYGLPLADVFPVSRGVATDPGLVASDGLHPSGKQYAAWTAIVSDAIARAHLFNE